MHRYPGMRVLLAGLLVLGAAAALGLRLVRAARPVDRPTELERRAKLHKATPDELVELGEVYLSRKEPLKAAEMAFRARAADRNLARAHNLLGALYVMGGEPGKARACFEEAVRVAPGSVPSRLSLARFEIQQQRPAAAISQLQEAARLAPREGQVWLLIGEAQRSVGSHSAAKDSFARAVGLDPQLAEAQAALGIEEMEFDHYAQAIPPLEKAYTLGDRSPVTLSCLALARLAGGATDADARRAEQVLDEAGRPDNPASWVAQGMLLHRKRNYSAARAAFQKVLRTNPRNERAQFALAEAYRAEGNLDAAEKALARHHELVTGRQRLNTLASELQQAGPRPALLRDYGKALLAAGHTQEAEAQFRAWVERAPRDPEAKEWLRRARESARGGA